MEFVIKDYSEIGKDTIRMVPEEWDRVRGLDNDGVIVKDNVVIGAILLDYHERFEYVYPSRPACLYLDVDTDGTGSSSSSVYAYMHCLQK